MGTSNSTSEHKSTMPTAPRDTPKHLTAEGIADILPHRYPFALIDQITDYEPGKWAMGIKCVSINEPFFTGHFPGHPIMPGVLLLEALAQTGAVALLSLPENSGKIALFGGVNKARFKRQVIPGDVVELKCELVRQEGPLGIGEAIATVGGKICVRAELLFAIS